MNEHVNELYKRSAELGFALFLTAASGLGQIVSAADSKCSPENLKGLQRIAKITERAVPKDDSYASTRGLSKGRERQLLQIAEKILREYAQKCGYKL